jgi:site-specific DNA-methyltransferase (adenine-specific)/modification methylase
MPVGRVEHIGRATLYLGDCRDILPTLPKVDAVVTDPPYGIGWDYASYEDTFDNWRDLMDSTIPLLKSVADNISLSVGPLEAEAHILWHHAPKWRACWYRGSTGARSPMGFRDYETVFLWGTPPRPMHDYFAIAPEMDRFGHSCPKPVGYAKWLIKRLTDSGTILDPFLGSGTTGVAAVQMGRNFIGCEMDPGYFATACKRIEDAQRQGDFFVEAAA